MNVSRMGRRLATAGVATALAAGAMVGASSTAANAVTGSANYTCATALGPVSLPVSVGGELPATALSGWSVPADIVPVSATTTLPATMVGALGSVLHLTEIGGSMPDFAMLLSNASGDTTAVPIDNLAAPLTAIPAIPADLPLQATGAIGNFVTPAAGTYDIKLPQSFNMQPVTAEGAPQLPAFPCTLDEGQNPVVGSIALSKQESTTTGAVKKTSAGYKATAKVVRQLGDAGLGKVVAKVDGKKVGAKALSNKGTVTFALSKLKKGAHTLKLAYKGDSSTKASAVSVPFKVK
jgi:Family of unknown function (DUF6801)